MRWGILSLLGKMTSTVQPAFMAFLSAVATNVTGNGTKYTLVCDTEAFDQGSNYNNSTGVFTAPVTGKYRFTANLLVYLAAAHNEWELRLVTTIRSYNAFDDNFAAGANPHIGWTTLSFNVLVNMNAGDTAQVDFYAYDGTQIVSVEGNATIATSYFCGELVC